MFGKKAARIKYLDNVVENLNAQIHAEKVDNALWASTLRNFVREKEMWDQDARAWETRYLDLTKHTNVDIRDRKSLIDIPTFQDLNRSEEIKSFTCICGFQPGEHCNCKQ